MKSHLNVGKLIEILSQYDERSLVKVLDKTYFELVFIDKIDTKVNPDSDYPDVIMEIKES
jgi:hypothetical protein